MKIERATKNDLKEILDLQYLAYESEGALYNNDAIQPLAQTLEELEEEFNERMILKAVMGKTIVGSVRAYRIDHTCKVGKLIVHPHYQNQGIGTQLMKEVELLFMTCSRFELFTGDRSTKNIYLYHKLGYRTFMKKEINKELTLVYMEKFGM